jgi:SAM-dependent methyltransferase
MTAALDVFDDALDGGQLWVHGRSGRRRLPVERWRARPAPADESLLARCTGPTLDVGCGPGRLVAALAGRGVPALGIDIAPAAVRSAQRSGACALRRSVFGRVPGAGRWPFALLADGNVGIGGNPVGLLGRVAVLLRAPGGVVLVEVDPPGSSTGIDVVRLEDGLGRCSAPFPWACLGVHDVATVTAGTGLRRVSAWDTDGRYFVALACGEGDPVALTSAPTPIRGGGEPT